MAIATFVLADISLTGLLWWLLVGLIAGFLASVVMRGGGYGVVGDIIVGIVGAFIGGWIGGALLGHGISGFFDLWSWILAIVGAVVLIWLVKLFTGRRV